MKKRKLLRNVSLVALSALMVGGTAMAFTGCNKKDPNVLDVFIFCSDADKATNQQIVDAAMEAFNKEYADLLKNKDGTQRTVRAEINNIADTAEYFKQLQQRLQNNEASDVVYISPKYATTYAQQGYVLDLTEYLTGKTDGMSAGATANANEIWGDALALYATYPETANGRTTYKNASEAVWNETDKVWKDGDTTVGIYGLPKDYSSFSMGYNRNFFKPEMKHAYTTAKASDSRNVTSWEYKANKAVAKDAKHTGGDTLKGKNQVATFAANGTYYVYDENGNRQPASIPAVAGMEAPLIAIGIPVRYKPFNFYKYTNFESAYNAGDPVALGVAAYSPDVDGDKIGDGYTVTIPGFPGETFAVDKKYQVEDAPYATDLGHTVLTYAEYGAMSWALSYYLTTFAWDNGQTLTSGNGGKYIVVYKEDGSVDTAKSYYQNVYGGEQYENSDFGINGYLLPWLVSNNATVVSSDYTRVWNTTNEPTSFTGTNKNVTDYIGTDSETIEKLNLDGSYRKAEVQYGFDSENFIETYGAFQEIASTWNANSGTAGDAASAQDRGNASGWTYFTQGATLFYGAGTWDASTRNESDTEDFWFGQMPVPVSEKFALYSQVRDGLYNIVEYSNANNEKGTGDGANKDYAQRTDVSTGKTVYTEAEIEANQLLRQDKWGARMDSVGYGVNSKVREYEGDSAWKEQAAVYVVEYLTINRDSQVTLTYAGAQLPNFVDQCEDFLKYNNDAYNKELAAAGKTNAFAAMITPDSTDDKSAKEGDVWEDYYEYAEALAVKAREEKKTSTNMTVQAYVQAHPTTTDGRTVKYDPSFADTKLADFAGNATSLRAFSMKVLRMVNFDKADRDLNMRMAYGLNSARDQLMYTMDTSWITELTAESAANPTHLLAYTNQKEIESVKGTTGLSGLVATNPQDMQSKSYWTPALNCIYNVRDAQTKLNATMNVEIKEGMGAIDG